ncbi:MAG: hydantoinase/oxoprolinase family protein [Deltaproteobacteria bacterium]|nr:hydantoinase/oxoprolinase family protein [Deltaproteobacteria bacterium]
MALGYRIGIDVGGTFTDFALVRPDGTVDVTKSLTTPQNQALGVIAGLRDLAAHEGRALEDLLGATDVVVHATTTADNTLIEHSGAVTGLVTTEGHRDEIEYRRGWRENIWDPTYPAPPVIAKRRFRIGVPGRLDHHGHELVPLDEDTVRRAARRFRDHGIQSVAVSLLFSFVDPSHEKRVAEILREEAPAARVYLSHEVMPAAPEFERTSTTLVTAFVGPKVVSYLERLGSELRQAGYANPLLIMQSNGGITTVEAVKQRPIVTLASGPAGGVTATVRVAASCKSKDFIGVDMGGTSYDVCLVRNGEPEIKSFWNWLYRHCIALPVVDVLSIGAGGGSIAQVNAGGLTVGPASAGSDPGPICYGRGGTRVTVTDANLVLGYLNPKALCGGSLAIHRDGVEDALRTQVAEPLGLSVIEAAAGIHRLTNANMNNAIRRVSSEKGHDPRKFDLVAFGGGGPTHATAQALEMGIERVIVPRLSPVLSAFGALTADFVVNQVHAHIAEVGLLDVAAVNAELASLRGRAEEELAQVGVRGDDVVHHVAFGCRYPGQTFTLSVPAELEGGAITRVTVDRVAARFHELHEELHTFATPNEPVVVAELTVRTVGTAPKPDLPRVAKGKGAIGAARTGTRKAHFGGEMVDTPIYDGALLGSGHVVEGPRDHRGGVLHDRRPPGPAVEDRRVRQPRHHPDRRQEIPSQDEAGGERRDGRS